ncbi:MAG: GMC oxidoreductase [Gemmatimonadota bacterium]
MRDDGFDTDVIVIGSGFGGSVAALRFAAAGHSVTVLERGDWICRENFEPDFDAFWNPRRHRFGMNELRPRGRHIIPWLGSAVGGGSHVYAGTLKRRDTFDGFPQAIDQEEMQEFYSRAEDVMDAQRYPEHPPYSDVRATQLLYRIADQLQKESADLVEAWGAINLGISFAPLGTEPGTEFVNKHGARQRYSDPREQSLLGGDIGTKNSLDRNYLFLAQELGAEVHALCSADRITPLEGGGFKVDLNRYRKESHFLRRFLRNWIPFLIQPRDEKLEVTCRRLVLSAGAIGSTELLLRNRDVHRTLPRLSSALGTRYTSNGDYVSAMLPTRGLMLGWAGFSLAVYGLLAGPLWLAVLGAAGYSIGFLRSRPAFDPDVGTTNSDYIKFRHRDGSSQGAYVESGRYPTAVRLLITVILSGIGIYRPRHYGKIIRFTRFLRRFVPPFGLLARTWPIPLLKMGRDDAYGTFRLNRRGEAVIDYDYRANQGYYRYLDRIGQAVAKTCGFLWIPNLPARVLRRLEIAHNQGGCPMADSADGGVVDHAGRVFGYDDLMVLDGSIIPVAPGPNPALTILALAERAMSHITKQLEQTGMITARLKRGPTIRAPGR